MGKIVRGTLIGLLVLVAGVYGADYGVWRVRGGPVGTVEVSRFVVASLKGNKEEYYPDGTAMVTCSRTIFPQTGAGACWWVESHRAVYDR